MHSLFSPSLEAVSSAGVLVLVLRMEQESSGLGNSANTQFFPVQWILGAPFFEDLEGNSGHTDLALIGM